MVIIKNDGSREDVDQIGYYVESEADISNIPDNAPASSIVMINASGGLVVKMKKIDGTWNTI